MGTVTTEQGAAALTNFLVGGTASFGDASYAASQALNAANTPDKVINAVTATADVSGVGATAAQIIQQFASNSSEAGALAGAIGSIAAQLAVTANAASITKSILQNGFGSLTASQMDAFSASLLSLRAIAAAPEAAVPLGVMAAGLMAFSWSRQANDTTVSGAFSQIKSAIQGYYSALSASDQATFSTSLSSAMQTVLSGGMLVPRIDGSGQIVGYYADLPSSAVEQTDGSTLYTFSSGVTFQQGVKNTSGSLQESSNPPENIWTFPDPSATSPATLGMLGDGGYSYNFKGPQNTDVAEVYIGDPGSYSISGSSGVATFGSVQSSNSNISVGANTQFNVAGSADHVTVNGAGSGVAIGGNGQHASDAQDDSVNFSTGGGNVTEADNSRVDVAGSGVTLNVGNNDFAGLGGSGNVANVSGTSSAVWIGNNGKYASNEQDNFVNFLNGVSGTVSEFDNSRADVNGNGVTLNAGTNDTFGLYGAGVTANVSGTGGSAWIGRNGQYATNDQNDHVNFFGGGAVTELDNSRVDVSGNGVTVSAGNNDTLGVSGTNVTANVSGVGGAVWIGGNGKYATSAQDNFVNFLNGVGGAVNEADNARVDVNGNDVTLNAGNNDAFGLYGFGVFANISGFGSAAWVGNNGQNATNAQKDTVSFANGVTGTVTELDNSRVDVTGSGVTLNAGNNDTLGGYGAGVTANVSGTGSAVWMGGNGQYATDAQNNHVNFLNGVSGTVNAEDNSRVDTSGNGITLNAGNGTTAGISGDRNLINFNGSGSSVWLNGSNEVANMVAGSVVNVSSGTGDVLNGSSAIINITGNNLTIWASGEYDVITCTGVGLTVYAQNSKVNMVGAAANNDSNHIIGSGNTGTGWTLGDGYQSLIGTPHPVGAPPPPSLPVFSDPSAGIPGSGTGGDGGVQVFPVPNPPDLNPIPIGGPPASDPIILSLDDQVVKTTALASSSTYFDMLNDGQKVRTAWGTAGEGYLVYDPNDRNNTTVVTQDNQLVGGFGALQSLAQQADGTAHNTLTASDALWDSLKVWVDTSGTGQFQGGQLMSLDQLGISSINLGGTQVDQNNNGNQVLVDSTFTRTDGSTGDIAGVNLMYNPTATASPVESQVRRLISAMASYAAPAASTTSVTPVHQENLATLAASLH